MPPPTLPILNETVLFKEERDKEALVLGQHIYQVTLLERADTITLNTWWVERFNPALRVSSTKWRHVSDDVWTRNVTRRVVLSFRQSVPRLYAIGDGGIRDISNNEEAIGAIRWQGHLSHHLKERFGAPWDGLYENLAWVRFQFAKDLPVPVANVDKSIPKNADVKKVSDLLLGEYARRSTRRGLLQFVESFGRFDLEKVRQHVQTFRVVAGAFDESEWGDLVASDNLNETSVAFLQMFSPARRRRLVHAQPGNPFIIYDVMHMWQQQGRPDMSQFRSWEEAHGWLVIQTNNRRFQRRLSQQNLLHEPVPQGPYQGVDGATKNGLRVVTPKTPADLLRWGMKLDHCIGSYAYRVLEGGTHCVAVHNERGHLEYTAEFSNGFVRQLAGYKNRLATAEDFCTFMEVMVEHGLAKSVTSCATYFVPHLQERAA